MYAAGQTFARELRYDRFGRLRAWTDGGGVRETATYDEAGTTRFRLSGLRVVGPGESAPVLQELGFGHYDAAGNLEVLTDPTPTGTYGANSPLRTAWT